MWLLTPTIPLNVHAAIHAWPKLVSKFQIVGAHNILGCSATGYSGLLIASHDSQELDRKFKWACHCLTSFNCLLPIQFWSSAGVLWARWEGLYRLMQRKTAVRLFGANKEQS